MTETPEGVVVTQDNDPACLCCCRPLSDHNAKRQCPETSYFVPNAAHTPTLRGEEVERLRKTLFKSYAFTGGHDIQGEYVKLRFHTAEDRHSFLDAYIAALSQLFAVDTGQSVPAGWVGWSGGAVPVQGTDARGLILFKGEAVEQAEARGEAILDYWPWYGEDEQPLAVAYKLATPAPSVSPDPATGYVSSGTIPSWMPDDTPVLLGSAGEVEAQAAIIRSLLNAAEAATMADDVIARQGLRNILARIDSAYTALERLEARALASSPIPKTFPREAVAAKVEQMTRHAKSLDALSEWLIANDHDMQLPDEVDDPSDAADTLRSVAALLQEDRQS